MPELSHLVPSHSGQVENFYLLVLGQVQMYKVYHWPAVGGPLLCASRDVAVLQMLITTTEEDLAQDENETLKKKDKDKKYHWNHGS